MENHNSINSKILICQDHIILLKMGFKIYLQKIQINKINKGDNNFNKIN